MMDKCRSWGRKYGTGFEVYITMADHEKKYEPALCMHCEGCGCMYCNGTGSVLVQAPKKKCPHCDGDGCLYCGFTGWHRPKGKYD
jgi:hypothetical protein